MKRVLILSSRREIIERISEALKDPEIETEVPGSQEGTSPIQAADLFIVDAHFSKEMVSEQLLKSNGSQPNNRVLVMGKENPDDETDKIVSLIEGHWLSINEHNESLVRHCINLCYETERLKYERNTELRNYNSLLQDATEGIFGVNTKFEITEVNKAFLKLFDLSYGQVRGRPLADFIVSKTRFRDKFTGINDEEDFEFKGYFGANDRKQFFGHLKLSPVKRVLAEDAEMVQTLKGYRGTLTDSGYKEKYQQVRRKSEQIEYTYRLARMLAHEIRNPLTNINLAIEELKASMVGADAEVYFDIMSRCSGRIDDLLNRLLHASEINIHDKREFDFMKVIGEIVRTVKDRTKLEGISIQTTFHDDEVILSGSPDRLRIALLNLCTNAIESIEHTQGEIILTAYRKEDEFYFQVKDNGKGIDEADRQKLFDPFYTTKRDGVGLGLTSTRTIITEHDGEIKCESHPGRGTVFTVILPIE